ncbi:uncharacterized protein WM277_008497 [Molossus nigricans]
MARERVRECAPPPPRRLDAPRPAFLRSWPPTIGQSRVTRGGSRRPLVRRARRGGAQASSEAAAFPDWQSEISDNLFKVSWPSSLHPEQTWLLWIGKAVVVIPASQDSSSALSYVDPNVPAGVEEPLLVSRAFWESFLEFLLVENCMFMLKDFGKL